MRLAVRAIEQVSRLCGALAAALVFVLMALMLYEVVQRYVFASPTAWSYDLSTMTMGAVFVLSIGYALATNAHVRVDLFHARLGPKARPLIDLVGHAAVMLPLLGWLSWSLWEYFEAAFLSGERSGASAWNPLVWPFRAVMFVGVAAWTLQVVAEIVKSALALAGKGAAAAPPEPGAD